MKVTKRLREFDGLEQALLVKVFEKIKNTPKDGQMRVFSGMLEVNHRKYLIECDFILKDLFLEVGELKINRHIETPLIIQ